MDFETIILGLMATAIFLVPIYLIQRSQKGQANRAKQAFLEAANLQGLRLGQHDFWSGQFGIGLDEAKSQLFYWQNDAHDPQEIVVDLNSVKQSAVENNYRDLNGNRIIDSIGLRLALQGDKAPTLYLPFYNKEGNMMLSGELQLAEKWHGIVQANKVSRQAVQV